MAKSNPVIDLTLDYHAHILPRCDHGSDGVETSLRQRRGAAAQAGASAHPAGGRGPDLRRHGAA